MKLWSILFMMFCSSCATMFNSGTQSITATTTSGAKVPVLVKTPSGSYRTTLPATITAKPSTFREVSITVEDQCFDKQTHDVGKSVAASYWANMFNVWGFFLDPFFGTMWEYDSQVSIPLNKKSECMAH